MKKSTLLLSIALSFGACAAEPGTGATPATPALAAPISLRSLLAEMSDRDTTAKWPVPAYTLKQASSYDRKSTNPADAATWFANYDSGEFIRIEETNQRREWVIMEHNGPGAVTRMWLPLEPTKDQQIIRFYFDGATTPAIEVPFNELMSGRGFVKPPLAFVAANESDLRNQLKAAPKVLRGVAGDLYLPIPFARSCKITLDQVPFYYIVNYRAYAPDVPLETFSMAGYEKAQTALAQAGEALLAAPDFKVGAAGQPTTLAPGEELALKLPAGAAAVRNLRVQIEPTAAPQALRSIVLTAEFDGEAAIWCPIGEFFGVGARLNPVQDWFRTVTADGAMFSRWVMPYQKAGRLALKNLGNEPVTVSLAALTTPWRWDEQSMLFHANWRFQSAINTAPPSEWNYIEIHGRGVYVGDTLTAFNRSDLWYGEGDEHVYIDGESFPSHLGTGTEDYYGYAWGMTGFFSSPFISQPQNDAPKGWKGFTTTSRVRLLDAIPLRTSLKFDMEIGHHTSTQLDYAVGMFWYARPGATHNRPPEPAAAALPLASLPAAGQKRPPLKIAGAQEGEALEMVARSPGLVAGVQDLRDGGGGWSGDAQLFAQAQKPGDFVEVAIAAPQPGAKTIILHATKSSDYGVIRFSVNGKPVDPNFDGFASQPIPSGPINLGVHQPQDGKFILRAEVVGTHPASTGKRYFFAIDCITLQAP
jgi:hypothetical protein